MIKSIDQLQLKLLELSDTERLRRHALLEIAFAEKTDQVEMLTKALKNSQKECAGVRSEMDMIVKAHTPLEKRS